MSGDSLGKNTLAPLLLRLALASIFIYHGVAKVATTGNDGGASWASNRWQRLDRPSADVYERIRAGVGLGQKDAIEQQLNLAYDETVPPIPPTLQNHVAQMVVAWGELLGGVALLLGYLTRLAALGEIAIQIGAVYWVTWAQGFSFARGGGYEYNLVLLVACLTLVFLGGGTLAVDQLLFRRRQRGRKAVVVAQEAVPAPQSAQPV